MKREQSLADRAQGALIGAFIGDALGVGPHWYYDLDALRRNYGPWIEGYTDPKPGHYHEGLKAGDLSQDGFILRLMTRSLVERGAYDQTDFCARLESELFSQLDGTPQSGPGGYTSQSIREAYAKRQAGLPWSETGGHADDTEALDRGIAIAVRYASSPRELAENVARNTALTQIDDAVMAMTCAFSCVVGLLIEGHAFDAGISGTLMARVKSGVLPFYAVTSGNLQPPAAGTEGQPRAGHFASPDALLTPSFVARAAVDPGIRIEPAWKVSLVYGMPCAIYHIVPAAYYLAARFRDDFESAVLHAINGGGQNQSRAMLTGALVGAQVGLAGIPERFIEGLSDKAALLQLAEQLAAQAGS